MSPTPLLHTAANVWKTSAGDTTARRGEHARCGAVQESRVKDRCYRPKGYESNQFRDGYRFTVCVPPKARVSVGISDW